MEVPFLCQPGNEKGCCACCGLFHLRDISREALDSFLRTNVTADNQSTGGQLETVCIGQAREADVYVCPAQVFIAPGRPGCGLFGGSGSRSKRDRSLYGGRICGSYFCPASVILRKEEKSFIADHAIGWYPYSIALIDPLHASYVIEKIKSCASLPQKEIGGLFTEAMILHSRYLNSIRGPVFFYSVPEYREGLKLRPSSELKPHLDETVSLIKRSVKPESGVFVGEAGHE